MSGMAMMLKSLGLDPDEIKKQIGQFGALVVELRDTMVRVEQKLDTIIADRKLIEPPKE